MSETKERETAPKRRLPFSQPVVLYLGSLVLLCLGGVYLLTRQPVLFKEAKQEVVDKAKDLAAKNPLKNNQTATNSAQPQDQYVKSERAVFATKIFPIRSKTFVKVRFKQAPNPVPIWLQLVTEPNTPPVSILIDDPRLEQISWPKRTTVQYTLYQKNPLYASVEEFLRKPPAEGAIAADPLLIDQKLVPPQTKALDSIEDLNAFDYILTTQMIY